MKTSYNDRTKVRLIPRDEIVNASAGDLEGAKFLQVDDSAFNRIFAVEHYAKYWSPEPVYIGTLDTIEIKSGIKVESGAFYVDEKDLFNAELWQKL